jgi:hypothetical protein
MKFYNAEYYDNETGCYSDPINDNPIEADNEDEARDLFFDWIAEEIRRLHSGEDPEEIEKMIDAERALAWKIYEITE